MPEHFQRSAILQKVRVSSLLAWEHFILHGEFDFSDARRQDSQKFDFDSMMAPKIVIAAGFLEQLQISDTQC